MNNNLYTYPTYWREKKKRKHTHTLPIKNKELQLKVVWDFIFYRLLFHRYFWPKSKLIVWWMQKKKKLDRGRAWWTSKKKKKQSSVPRDQHGDGDNFHETKKKIFKTRINNYHSGCCCCSGFYCYSIDCLECWWRMLLTIRWRYCAICVLVLYFHIHNVSFLSIVHLSYSANYKIESGNYLHSPFIFHDIIIVQYLHIHMYDGIAQCTDTRDMTYKRPLKSAFTTYRYFAFETRSMCGGNVTLSLVCHRQCMQ